MVIRQVNSSRFEVSGSRSSHGGDNWQNPSILRGPDVFAEKPSREPRPRVSGIPSGEETSARRADSKRKRAFYPRRRSGCNVWRVNDTRSLSGVQYFFLIVSSLVYFVSALVPRTRPPANTIRKVRNHVSYDIKLNYIPGGGRNCGTLSHCDRANPFSLVKLQTSSSRETFARVSRLSRLFLFITSTAREHRGNSPVPHFFYIPEEICPWLQREEHGGTRIGSSPHERRRMGRKSWRSWSPLDASWKRERERSRHSLSFASRLISELSRLSYL